MRYAVVCLCILLSVVSTKAFAQVQGRDANGNVVMHYYPPEAQERGIEGIGVVCCTVRADGSLDCSAPYEWPADHGFGHATLLVARHFRISSEDIVEGAQIKRVIRWVLPTSQNPGGGPDFAAALEVAQATTCETPTPAPTE